MPKSYTLAIESLVKPLPPQQQADRRAWSIPLSAVWVPFFTALKVEAKVDIADETLGAPLRLATNKDGTPRFNSKGFPMTTVAKELATQVRVVRENFVATLVVYASGVRREKPADYKAQVEHSRDAGEAVLNADADKVLRYLENQKAVQAAVEAAHAAITPTPERELVAA